MLLGARTILDEDNGESDTRVRLYRTEKGSLVWAWDRIEHGYLPDEPEPEQIQRADPLVISATEGSRPAAEAWTRRPTGNGRLAEASVRVWLTAAMARKTVTLPPSIASAVMTTLAGPYKRLQVVYPNVPQFNQSASVAYSVQTAGSTFASANRCQEGGQFYSATRWGRTDRESARE